jgi:sulfite exporter TauE/SafE
MEFAQINSPAAAFVAGLVTSLHCAGMCGPLACVIVPGPGSRRDAQTTSTVYHLGRLASYGTLGAIAGATGRLPLAGLPSGVLRFLPWALVALFVGLALRLDRHLPKLRALSAASWRLAGRLRHRSPIATALTLGLATPALPCGPLYFLLALALLSGSAARGAGFMVAFGLGTVPLLWVAQLQFGRLRAALSTPWSNRLRLALALSAATVVVWRLRSTLGFAGPEVSSLVCF